MTYTLGPIPFREACVEFMEFWETLGEAGEPIDDQIAYDWFLERFEAEGVDVASTTLRFLETMDALDEAPLCEFVASADDDLEEIPKVVFESAALAPMSDEGKLDTAWIARDLMERLRVVATVERLLGDA